MNPCPTCGRQSTNTTKIILCVAGLFVAAIVVLPMIAIMGLVVVASVGASASSEFDAISDELETHQVSTEYVESPKVDLSNIH